MTIFYMIFTAIMLASLLIKEIESLKKSTRYALGTLGNISGSILVIALYINLYWTS